MAQGNSRKSAPSTDNRRESGSEKFSDSVRVRESSPISTSPIHLSSTWKKKEVSSKEKNEIINKIVEYQTAIAKLLYKLV